MQNCNSTGSTCQFPGLDCGETYNLTVTAYLQGCSSQASSTVFIRTGTAEATLNQVLYLRYLYFNSVFPFHATEYFYFQGHFWSHLFYSYFDRLRFYVQNIRWFHKVWCSVKRLNYSTVYEVVQCPAPPPPALIFKRYAYTLRHHNNETAIHYTW